MGSLRKCEMSKRKLEQLAITTDLKSALEQMVDLQGNISIEEEVVKSYDEKTGKPATFAWESHKRFGTEFTFDKKNYGEWIEVNLTDSVVDEIKKGPVCFDKNDKKYVAKFETKYHGGSDRGDLVFGVEYLIYLSEVREI